MTRNPANARKRNAPPPTILAPGWDGAIRLDLPLPTSVNAIWRRSKFSTYLSESYKNWKVRASEALGLQRPAQAIASIPGHFNAAMMLPEGKRGTSDLDNRIKAALDWAKADGLITDDRLANRILLEWGPVPKSRSILWLIPAEPDLP